MKTQAAVMRTGSDPFTIETLDLGEPNASEVVVRMVSVGMCHTDLLGREMPPALWRGPAVYGHEGAGVVESLGADVTSVSAGDHVVLSFSSCGACPTCDTNRPAYCFNFPAHNQSGGRPDGTSSLTDEAGDRINSHWFGQSSFSQYSIVAESSLVKVDKSLDLTKLGPLGCGIQTGAGAIMNTFDVQAGESVVIGGAGALGLAAVMATKVVGAGTVIAIDRHVSRLELAKKYGATHVVQGDPSEITAQIREITGTGADYAFDTSGNAGLGRALFDSLSPVGTLGIAGVGFGELAIPQLGLFPGRVVRGVFEGDAIPSEFIPKLAQLNVDGKFPFDELNKNYALEDINEAEQQSASGEVIKPVIIFRN